MVAEKQILLDFSTGIFIIPKKMEPHSSRELHKFDGRKNLSQINFGEKAISYQSITLSSRMFTQAIFNPTLEFSFGYLPSYQQFSHLLPFEEPYAMIDFCFLSEKSAMSS